MASAWLHLRPPLSKLSQQRAHQITSLTSLKFTTSTKTNFITKPLSVRFALTQSDSSNSKSIEPDPSALLQHIADSFDLPSDYFAQLPRDLRLDLNDAAFDLSKGPVLDECGQELGEILLNITRAWERGDTSASYSLLTKLPSMEENLTGSAKSALGKRLVSAGRRFQSMGQYGQGEPQKIAKAMITAGKALSAISTSARIDEQPKEAARMLKFGELQLEITPDNANIGAVIGVVFGILSFEIANGIENIPESSLQYANDNALLLAKGSLACSILLFHGPVCIHNSWACSTWDTTKIKERLSFSVLLLIVCGGEKKQVLFG
ncbi:hypothetical protein Ahy_A09g043980 isoform C [Arachis hypogaea]|uniref:Uncharacterized protein n=1 Tax=Arachis hypogaea TaxID=3818 RepID=A0A445BJD8_ARAHY|nr:hypothetical protein Ahy_A09g043980 isoform C [Arachis hypogaea]